MGEFWDSHDAGPEWATPRYIWEPLSDALGGFDLDPASGCEPDPIAKTCFTVLGEEGGGYRVKDGLKADWFGDVWVNPPYGKKFNDVWAEKIAREAARREVDTVTALIAAATSTIRWHEHFQNAQLFTFIRGRVQFLGAGDSGGTFASVLVSFGQFPPEYVEALRGLGLVLGKGVGKGVEWFG